MMHVISVKVQTLDVWNVCWSCAAWSALCC